VGGDILRGANHQTRVMLKCAVTNSATTYVASIKLCDWKNSYQSA
jgi:hypothetical protein